MTSYVSDADLTASLTCSICFDLFEGDPRVLPCGHTNCTRCLEELRCVRKDTIKCPECRAECPLPVAQLAVNFTAKQLVELRKAREGVKKRKENEKLEHFVEKEQMIQKLIRKFEYEIKRKEVMEKWQKSGEEEKKRKAEEERKKEEEEQKELAEKYQIAISIVRDNWTSEPYLLNGLKRWHTVAILKAEIAGRFGIPTWRQKLFYCGAELKDENTLQYYSIVKHPIDCVYVYRI